MNKTNCPNCGAPIIFGMVKCPYCDTPYEAPGGSESGELNRDIDSPEKLEQAIGSRWDFDDDFAERAARYSRGEPLKPKWVPEEEPAPVEPVHIEDRSGIWEEVKKIFKCKKPKPVNTIELEAKYEYVKRRNALKGEIE